MVEQQAIAAAAHIFSIGPFGHRVAKFLTTFRGDVFHTPLSEAALDFEGVRRARIQIVAAWRPVPTLCERLNEISFESTCPFVPVIIDATVLQVGPVVVPGLKGCWTCWTKRCSQHMPKSSEQFELARHYASHPNQGPGGYLPPFAALAASRLSEIIDAIDLGEDIGGHVWRIDMITRKTTVATMVGVHGCPQCGLPRPEETRSIDDIRAQLSYLWSDSSPKGE
jgi:bacteriocin biosynthesis cyclodehydratase domain-containing protein